MLFKIIAEKPPGDEGAGERRAFAYDNERSVLQDIETGYVYQAPDLQLPTEKPAAARTFCKGDPLTKADAPSILKIQLGLSCNYACTYCSQRFVERTDETSAKHLEPFLKSLDRLRLEDGILGKVEFWGGEPFVYWKTLRPLAEALFARFMFWTNRPKFLIITNGSLLTTEINDWLVKHGFSVAVSHDGPGQHVRGPDPLDDPAQKAIILDLYARLRPLNRMSFNAMLNRHNLSRKAIRDFFVDLTGDQTVPIGEGHLIDAYDDDGLDCSLHGDEHFEFRRLAFSDLVDMGDRPCFTGPVMGINGLIRSILNHTPAATIGQKCGMDQDDVLTVDLRGNVITCQNVSAVATAMNGRPHLSGNINAGIEKARIHAATHWRHRPACAGCPMLHLCRGSCMYLEGENWHASCDNAYSNAVPLFAMAVQVLTGYVPVAIEGAGLPAHRADLWGTRGALGPRTRAPGVDDAHGPSEAP